MDDAPTARPVTCSGCGRHEPSAPVTWSSQTSARGPTLLCDACTRTNLRSIEGKLDEAWW